MSNKAIEVASILATLRRGTRAAGAIITLPTTEVLLLVAGGVDHTSDLVKATGSDRTQITRALQFLQGQSFPNHGRIRVSPFRLVECRKHPHRKGHQLRLAPEGIALLSPTFTRLHTPDWT